MSGSIISNHKINSDAIAPILENIEEAIQGYDRNHIILALLCMTFMLSDPDIPNEPEKLAKYFHSTSHYIVMLLGTQWETIN